MTTRTASDVKIDAREYYAQFQGHPTKHLEALLPKLRAASERLIWLAGDSSLDNKYWFRETAPAEGVYKDVLYPPTMKCDVTYWINQLLAEQQQNGGNNQNRDMAVINTAVEATTLNERTFKLRSQDKLIRDNLQPEDILVVSVGGNDVALCPCPCTIASMCCLLCCLPSSCTEQGQTCGTVPMDDCCCGCGPSLASCACACPPCLGYVRHLFGTRVEMYIRALTKRQRPKKILVCMIYFPDEAMAPSWASGALAALGYNDNPSKLQALIRKAFVEATCNIQIPGSEVIPVALFHPLDGKHSEDYMARVEPSPVGGKKMAEHFLHLIHQSEQQQQSTSAASAVDETGYIMQNSAAPTTSYMRDR